jgi:hypothetical protein
MRFVVKTLTIVTAVGLMSAIPAARADDPSPATQPATVDAASGAVMGTVMKDGKALADVQVRLVLATRGQPATAPAAPAKGAGRAKRQVVAEATTDANGNFTLSDVPAGMYRVVAGQRGGKQATGDVGAVRVTVAAGQTVQVSVTVGPPNAARTAHHHKKAGK